MDALIAEISTAFSPRAYPGDQNITRCTYDKKNGGSYDGPCWECEEMADFFKGKDWRDLKGRDLRQHGDNDALFTVSAYCYFLPAYLIAAISDPKALDVCVDHLTYRFGPKVDEEWGTQRLAGIRTELNVAETRVALEYFRFAMHREPRDFDGFCQRAIQNLEGCT